jgi:hypothetical protein
LFCFVFQATQVLSICTQNLAKIMGNVDPNQTTVHKSVPALIDWGQNLFALAERFEVDAKSQLAASLEKEQTQPENCSIRMTMGDIYEKVLFFLNHMTHSYIDYSRSESPMSASYEAQIPPGSLQRFRTQQQSQYRRWSEAAATSMNESNELNVDSNRRWSMPTNVRQTRSIPTIMKPSSGVQSTQLSQSSIGDPSTVSCSDGISEAIQLLSLTTRTTTQSRPPSQHCLQPPPPFTSQYRTSRETQRTQRQPRGELNEILLLQRTPNDSGYFGRCQQIAENVRGESDENQ